MKNNAKIVLLLLGALLFFNSCDQNGGGNSEDVLAQELEQTAIPSDVSRLYVEKGNSSSDIAVLYCNGGPSTSLDREEFDDMGLSAYHEVYVHQANTYNASIITELKDGLSFDRAIREDGVSVEMLYRVAKHFKDQGKSVYIVSHSFGSFLVPSFMAEHYDTADKYLIMAGRLDMPEVVWQGFRDGKGYMFSEGVTPVQLPFPAEASEDQIGQYKAAMRLQAGFGRNRYTGMLKDLDMTGRVIYAYGEKDAAVGRLSAAERSFLAARGADVYAVPESGVEGDDGYIDGGHGSMFDGVHKTALKNKLIGTP